MNTKKRVFYLVIALLIGGILVRYQCQLAYWGKALLPRQTHTIHISPLPQIVDSVPMPTTFSNDTPLDGQNHISLDTLFEYQDPMQSLSQPNGSAIYTLIATGDVIPARSVNAKVVAKQDFTYPYAKTRDLLKSGDLLLVNLETPLISECKPTLEGMVFCGDERNVQGLVFAGVTVAGIANNHAGNYGIEGIKNTKALLEKNNIAVTGQGKPAIVKVRDTSFGFLAYNAIGAKEQGIAWAEDTQIQSDIQSLRKQVDFVIVSFHWGEEYTSLPTSRQKETAHLAIDAGADLIIGNHPHWVQAVELYNGKYITYAHGNFVFDQMWSQETREGVVGKYVFNRQGLIAVIYYPVIIDDYSQPRYATETEAKKILDRMKVASQKVAALAK